MGTLNRERGCMSVAINVKRIGFEEKGQNEKKRSQDRSDQIRSETVQYIVTRNKGQAIQF